MPQKSINRSLKRLLFAAFVSLLCFAATSYWYKATDKSRTHNENQKAVAYVNQTKDEIHRRPVTRIIWQLITDGEPLYPGEAVRTSSIGEVRIQFADSSRFIDLEPDSLIVISQSNKNEISLDLLDGSLMVNQGAGGSAEGGPALTLSSGQSKVDLSQATASLSKTNSGNIDLQVLKGKAKVESNGQSKEIESGKSGALGSQGVTVDTAQLQIISPPLDKATYINPDSPQDVIFSWKGFPPNSLVTLSTGKQRKDLKVRGETAQGKVALKLFQGKYYWKLTAKDSQTQKVIGESPLYRLEVAAHFPPSLLLPHADEIIIKSQTQPEVEFRWVKPKEATNISVEVASDQKLEHKVFSKNFTTEETTKQTFPEGEYYIRISANYEGSEKSISSKIQKFYLRSKSSAPPVSIGWLNPNESSPQYYLEKPLVNLSWNSEQKNQVKLWRLKIAESEESLSSSEAISFETTELNLKSPVAKPGRYIAMVEALNDKREVLGVSVVKSLEVAPLPLLPTTAFLPLEGELKADNKGRLELKWNSVEGAKEYQLTLFTSEGKEMRTSKSAKNSTALVNMLPGDYQVGITAIDQYGRAGQKETPRKVQVPDVSSLAAPKLKKIKVN